MSKHTLAKSHVDDAIDDATHAAANALRAAGVEALNGAERVQILYAINDAITSIIAPLVQVHDDIGEGEE
jgi:3-dehydroquinate dehydratase